MAQLNVFLCFLVLLSFTSFCQGAKWWCVADEWATDVTLSAFLDRACNRGYCIDIKPGKPCFLPPTIRSHASYVLNLMYTRTSKCPPHLGIRVQNDPSYGRCKYR
ncbi:glucan endo-1,3-beta-glucosidase 12-like [Nicotiana tabacum]|uniref:Glucan endo-1,3-beta-glucosidase 12-like n=1 Tax=Nicotiana tabacum TaxID=4097 RepID=A0A1S4BGS4_TOBAC|nr:glucan endo-1,3-beta-glucosidase 12-like [Nicotiana tomentosiformis]XP_016488052.1 PREDICTED: glucan endo-1,3-beta-glucosidase 12-like [Nicotiana tabacum]